MQEKGSVASPINQSIIEWTVNLLSKELKQRRLMEAWALLRKGDHFGIGRRFLIQHGVI